MPPVRALWPLVGAGLFAGLSLLAWPSLAGAARPLSPTERRIVASVDAHAPGALALLERAVDINSGTLNLEGVRRVGALLRPEFDRLGFKTEWVDGAAWGRAGHLIAKREGRSKAPRALLIGHL